MVVVDHAVVRAGGQAPEHGGEHTLRCFLSPPPLSPPLPLPPPPPRVASPPPAGFVFCLCFSSFGLWVSPVLLSTSLGVCAQPAEACVHVVLS